MATVDSRDIVDEIIEHDGLYPGDDIRVVKVVQYENDFNGKLAYGLVYEGEDLMRYETAPACHNPKVLWSHAPLEG